jgi:hypothetical protein
MARGGRRRGTAGKAYPNRTDLNGGTQVKIPGQEYGAQAEQVRAQQALPVAAPPTPDDAPSLLEGQSQRPNEPLTAGLPSGPGPGPEAINALSNVGAPKPGFDDLEAIYRVFPYPGIRDLIRWGSK